MLMKLPEVVSGFFVATFRDDNSIYYILCTIKGEIITFPSVQSGVDYCIDKIGKLACDKVMMRLSYASKNYLTTNMPYEHKLFSFILGKPIIHGIDLSHHAIEAFRWSSCFVVMPGELNG